MGRPVRRRGGGCVPARRHVTGVPRVGRTRRSGAGSQRHPHGQHLRRGLRARRWPSPAPACTDHPAPDGTHRGPGRRPGPTGPGHRGRLGATRRCRRARDGTTPLSPAGDISTGQNVLGASGGGRESNPPEVVSNLSPVLKTGGPTRRPDTSKRVLRGDERSGPPTRQVGARRPLQRVAPPESRDDLPR